MESLKKLLSEKQLHIDTVEKRIRYVVASVFSKFHRLMLVAIQIHQSSGCAEGSVLNNAFSYVEGLAKEMFCVCFLNHFASHTVPPPLRSVRTGKKVKYSPNFASAVLGVWNAFLEVRMVVYLACFRSFKVPLYLKAFDMAK